MVALVLNNFIIGHILKKQGREKQFSIDLIHMQSHMCLHADKMLCKPNETFHPFFFFALFSVLAEGAS